MIEIKPTKKQVFDELKHGVGCCWLGGSGCHCYSRQLCDCFKEMEKRLTKHECTEKEIKDAQERNTKAMHDINDALSMLFD